MRLELALRESRMSKRQLAIRLAAERGITYHAAKSSVAKWSRKGGNEPRATNLAALSKILGKDFSEPDPLVDALADIKALLAGAQSSLVEVARMQGLAMQDQAALLKELAAAVADLRAMLDDPAQPERGQR